MADADSKTRTQSTGKRPATRPIAPIAQSVGWLGEELVARWLAGHGWQILAQRWRCRWGELDIVAVPSLLPSSSPPSPPSSTSKPPLQSLLFVEVKTRSAANWDADGVLAISPQKQAKLWRSASLFLSHHPQYSDAACRFDVALVRCDRPVDQALSNPAELVWPDCISGSEPIAIRGCRLHIVGYLEGAIEADL